MGFFETKADYTEIPEITDEQKLRIRNAVTMYVPADARLEYLQMLGIEDPPPRSCKTGTHLVTPENTGYKGRFEKYCKDCEREKRRERRSE